ncbi:MAG: segregation/condensation protein A [Caldilineaceae bacterium]|nr:segregation/condensation protein A [Caldilineaceae bacterium]
MMLDSLIGGYDRTLGAAYAVSLPSFQGPLDLLLQLIEKEELDINEISLVAVTDPYLRTIAHLEELVPGALADFLVIASRLLYLKSLSLLPKPHPATEIEEDSADALIQQLLEYRRFKQAAASLQEREEQGLRLYARTAPKPVLEKRLDLSNLDLTKLHIALRRVLQRMPNEPPMPRVKTYPITVAEQIELVRAYVQQIYPSPVLEPPARPIFFTELLSQGGTRLEIVVTFLAILELIKQRELVAEQDATFGEIVLLPCPPTDHHMSDP